MAMAMIVMIISFICKCFYKNRAKVVKILHIRKFLLIVYTFVFYLVHENHIPLSRRYPEDTLKIDMRRWSKEYWLNSLPVVKYF